MNKKAIIAMSGGVDSSVAAYLMLNQGYECAGATMQLYDKPQCSAAGSRACCTPSDTEDARHVAARLGMLYYVFPMQEEFRKNVIQKFTDTYFAGGTPNPCIDCNRFLKFDAFLQKAEELGAEYIATGHYARIEQNPETGRYLLKKGLDPSKDQSYVLYSMNQRQLAHTILPLGRYTKADIRRIAQEQGFVNAEKPESQDICFVPDGDYASFIEEYTGKHSQPGDFVDREGNVLGRHKGQIHYTVGQRRGLGISAPESLYVCGKSLEDNTVILGRKQDLMSDHCFVSDINLIPWDHLPGPTECKVKVRYRQPEQPAVVEQVGEDLLKITFREPQRAVTPGQAAVLYDGDTVLGGGTILSEETISAY